MDLPADLAGPLAEPRLPKGSLPAIVMDVVLRLLACLCLLGGVIRRFFKMENMEPVLENHGTEVEKNEELLHPCYQKLQQLENMVNELSKKPAKIPSEKEDMIHESLNRIKSIEHDLQKTKRVRCVPPSIFSSVSPVLLPPSVQNEVIERTICYSGQALLATASRQVELSESLETLKETNLKVSSYLLVQYISCVVVLVIDDIPAICSNQRQGTQSCWLRSNRSLPRGD